MHQLCGKGSPSSLSTFTKYLQHCHNNTPALPMATRLASKEAPGACSLANVSQLNNKNLWEGKELLACVFECGYVCVCVCVWYRWWPTGRWPLIIFFSPYPVPMLCCVFSIINVLLVSHVPDDISRPEQLLCISIRDLKTCMKRLVKVLGWVSNILRLGGRNHKVLVDVFRRQRVPSIHNLLEFMAQ